MLNIFYGDMPEAIYNTSIYFNNTYLDKWFDDPLTLRIIEAIDKGKVVSPQCIITKALGAITARELAGGTKTLLLMRHAPERIYNASTCGDNCAKWILHIAGELEKQSKDLIIRLGYLMDFGKEPFEIEVHNLGLLVHNRKELAETVLDNKLI